MPNWDFGITATVVGMITTFVVLIVLGLVMDVLKKAFPIESAKKEKPAPKDATKEAPQQS
jgi:Na+-transporting methylmalonyl-CoA/oxaloacetate decarboxylase gamma subunit